MFEATQPAKTSRRHMLASAAGASALALGAGLAPGLAQAGASAGIVGAWTVQVSSTSSPYQGVQIVHGDGTLALALAPSGPSASGQPPRLYAPGAGAWAKALDGGYDFTLAAPSVTTDGLYQGQVVVNGHARLDEAMQTFEATYTSHSTSADGGLVGTNRGAITGTRIVLGGQ